MILNNYLIILSYSIILIGLSSVRKPIIVMISLGSEEFEPIRDEDGGADLSPRPIEDCLGLYIWILNK